MIRERIDLIILPELLFYSDGQARANSVDPDQTPQNAASDQGLHCWPLTQQFYTHSGSKMDLLKRSTRKGVPILSDLSKISHENEILSQRWGKGWSWGWGVRVRFSSTEPPPPSPPPHPPLNPPLAPAMPHTLIRALP